MYLNKNIKINDQNKNKIKEEIKEILMNDITDTIEKSKSVKCEYLGLKEYFSISYPQELKKVDWLQTYLDSDVSVSVDTSLETEAFDD